MAKKTYYEKLKDPRWQKLRLKVMEAADWRCQCCGKQSETLTVHHGTYTVLNLKSGEFKKSPDPWDVPMDSLWCLCDKCHEKCQHRWNLIKLVIGRIHPTRYFDLLTKLNEYAAPKSK